MTLLATPPVVLRSVEGFVPTGMKLTADKAIVVVSLLVRWDGTITEPYVVSTPDPALNSAALASAKKWRFKAAQSVDRPVDMRTEIEVVFLR